MHLLIISMWQVLVPELSMFEGWIKLDEIELVEFTFWFALEMNWRDVS